MFIGFDLLCVFNYTYNILRYKKENKHNVLLNYFSNVLKQASSILIAVFFIAFTYALFLVLFEVEAKRVSTVLFVALLSTIQVLLLFFVIANMRETSRTDDTTTQVLAENNEISVESDYVLHGFSTNTNEIAVFFGASVATSRLGLLIRQITVFIRKRNYTLILNENQAKLISLKKFTRKVKPVPQTVFDWSMIQNIEVFKTKFGNNHYAIKMYFSKGGVFQFEFTMAKQKENFLKFKDLYEKKYNKQLSKAKMKIFY